MNQRQVPGYEYDLDGRLIRTPTSLYTYDALDRLKSVTKDGITTTYSYDSFNRRLVKSGALFLYDGQREIGCYQNGQLTEFRTLAPTESEIGSAIGIEINNTDYVPIHDITGSVSALLDTNGNLVEPYRYTAFGEETSHSTLNSWRFASKRYDAESGLIYFGTRYYDPSLGCWISPDPIGYEDGPNLYAYVSNNPLTHYDAYGLLEEDANESDKDDQTITRENISNDRSALDNVKDFGTGLVTGFWDPISTGYEYYNGDYREKSYGRMAGETIGALANLNPLSLEKVCLSQATKTIPYVLKAFNWFRGACNPRTVKNIAQVGRIANASEKTAQLATRARNVALETKNLKTVTKVGRDKWKFPSNPADLLKELPRDSKGHIYVNDKMRIRPEKHAREPWESYCPRHHDQHYHVEYTSHPENKWTRTKKIHKFKPKNYKLNDGTGFLPGEFFPGAE